MIQPDAYVRRLTFKQREDQGAKGAAIRNQFGSSAPRRRRWGGSISPNSASTSRARSQTCGREYLLHCLIVAWEKRAAGENSSPRRTFSPQWNSSLFRLPWAFSRHSLFSSCSPPPPLPLLTVFPATQLASLCHCGTTRTPRGYSLYGSVRTPEDRRTGMHPKILGQLNSRPIELEKVTGDSRGRDGAKRLERRSLAEKQTRVKLIVQ